MLSNNTLQPTAKPLCDRAAAELFVSCLLKSTDMTLHEAIEKLLRKTGKAMTTNEIAELLNENKWYQKKDGSKITAFQIHGRTKNYPHIFERKGSKVSLSESAKNTNEIENDKRMKPKRIVTIERDSDEKYIIDICDKILGINSSRQHKFDFLRGDLNSTGRSVMLPVDTYYEELNLVIEYRERQHTESVNFFDKPTKMTISGVHRGEQRRIYDERRRTVLPQKGIKLIEISYSEFKHDVQKKLLRDIEADYKVLERFLKDVKKKSN